MGEVVVKQSKDIYDNSFWRITVIKDDGTAMETTTDCNTKISEILNNFIVDGIKP
jgi:hypothetical protein